jgi:hypothetical protein
MLQAYRLLVCAPSATPKKFQIWNLLWLMICCPQVFATFLPYSHPVLSSSLTAVQSIKRNLLFNDIPTGKVIPSLGDVNKVISF